MDSLIATYACSDEEEHSHTPSIFSSLPPPSHNFPSLSPPKNSSSSRKSPIKDVAGQESKSKPSSLFGNLPPPKPQKRLVEFKPPISYVLPHDDDDDDDDDGDVPRPKKRPSSNASTSVGGLFAVLPPPKNTPLGDSGHAGRRSLVEVPSSDPQPSPRESYSLEPPQYAQEYVEAPQYAQEYVEAPQYDANCYNSNNYSADPAYNMAVCSQSHGHDNWAMSTSEEPQLQHQEIGGRGKAERRNQIPCDIIEVKQDELMNNRPREDQVKLTGIAFGPSYKPVSAAKDKPSKLHKRKHQIGSLYYDLKQKEMELAERRARGQLTKAETQAKYGW